MSHPPGPWTAGVDNFGDGDGWQYTVTANDRHDLLAAVFPSTEDDSKHDIPEDGQANARLIAAAPDLLAALENVAGIAKQIGDADANVRSIEDIARASIAKATDET
jgi:hypothetical protein